MVRYLLKAGEAVLALLLLPLTLLIAVPICFVYGVVQQRLDYARHPEEYE